MKYYFMERAGFDVKMIEIRYKNVLNHCEIAAVGLKQRLLQKTEDARKITMDKLHEALISIRRILRASDIHAKGLVR